MDSADILLHICHACFLNVLTYRASASGQKRHAEAIVALPQAGTGMHRLSWRCLRPEQACRGCHGAAPGQNRHAEAVVALLQVGIEALKEAFRDAGDIASAVVMRDQSGASRGFGFVNFEEAEAADRAVANFDNLPSTHAQSAWLVGASLDPKLERLVIPTAALDSARAQTFPARSSRDEWRYNCNPFSLLCCCNLEP